MADKQILLTKLAELHGAQAVDIIDNFEDTRDTIDYIKLVTLDDPVDTVAPIWHKSAKVYWDGKHILVLDKRNNVVTLYESGIDSALAAFQQWRMHFAGAVPVVQGTREG